MSPMKSLFLVSAAAALGGAALSRAPAAAPGGDAALVRSAMSAAPASVARNAAIVVPGPRGSMRVIRRGGNGFTCMPDDPSTPGPDPMCGDANSMQWGEALTHHRPPPAGQVGMMYMLQGGTDASNVDPYAKAPPRGAHWISTGPHIMILGSQSLLRGYPSGANPDTSRAYVMWAGTPYAHLMVPVR